MADEYEDDQLRQAVELSLREHKHEPTQPFQNNAHSQAEAEGLVFQRQLEQAIQESRKTLSTVPVYIENQELGSQGMGGKTKTVATTETANTNVSLDTSKSGPTSPQDPQASSFLSDRAKLEEERLARQKRLRPDIFQDDDNEEGEGASRPVKRQHIPSLLPDGGADLDSRLCSLLKETDLGNYQGAVYWDGEVRQTACIMSEPRKDERQTFRLSEIIGNVSIKPVYS
jgi:hypothetical protein